MKQRLSKMTRAELELLPTDVLDRAAFGFKSGDLLHVDVADITIRYADDLANARDDVKDVAMAKRILAKKEPVEITLRKGRLELEDGHHRFVSARLLKRKTLPAVVTIDDNPINMLLADRR